MKSEVRTVCLAQTESRQVYVRYRARGCATTIESCITQSNRAAHDSLRRTAQSADRPLGIRYSFRKCIFAPRDYAGALSLDNWASRQEEKKDNSQLEYCKVLSKDRRKTSCLAVEKFIASRHIGCSVDCQTV
jgi:hypothetical protein